MRQGTLGWMGLLIATLAVAAALWLTIGTRWQAAASAKWPQVDGVVTASGIVTRPVRRGENHQPRIEYRYRVAGAVYVGTRLGWDTTVGTQAIAQHFVDEYPVGRTVQVHVNPKRPDEAVLEPRVLTDDNAPWLPALIVAGALYLLWQWWRFLRT